MSNRLLTRKLFLILASIILVCLVIFTLSLVGNSQERYYKEFNLVIPGTYGIDLDTPALTCTKSHYLDYAIPNAPDPSHLNFANKSAEDLWWKHVNERERFLVAESGAKISRLNSIRISDDKIDFNEITHSDLVDANYIIEKLEGSDWNNKLQIGSVFAIKTNKGNYAKLKVTGYKPFEDNSNYHIKLLMKLFPPKC